MRTAADVGNAVSEGLLKLDVLVVHEDFGTGLRARRALDQTAQLFAVEADLKVNLWDFGLLREPALYEQAAHEAAEADIVFVSAHGQDELPVSLKLWVQQWLAREGRGPSALVMSLDADAGDSPSVIQMLEALHSAARLAGVDFILHWGESQPEWESDLEEIQRRAETRTTLLDGVLPQVDP
jgi:hypothetical protein